MAVNNAFISVGCYYLLALEKVRVLYILFLLKILFVTLVLYGANGRGMLL